MFQTKLMFCLIVHSFVVIHLHYALQNEFIPEDAKPDQMDFVYTFLTTTSTTPQSEWPFVAPLKPEFKFTKDLTTPYIPEVTTSISTSTTSTSTTPISSTSSTTPFPLDFDPYTTASTSMEPFEIPTTFVKTISETTTPEARDQNIPTPAIDLYPISDELIPKITMDDSIPIKPESSTKTYESTPDPLSEIIDSLLTTSPIKETTPSHFFNDSNDKCKFICQYDRRKSDFNEKNRQSIIKSMVLRLEQLNEKINERKAKCKKIKNILHAYELSLASKKNDKFLEDKHAKINRRAESCLSKLRFRMNKYEEYSQKIKDLQISNSQNEGSIVPPPVPIPLSPNPISVPSTSNNNNNLIANNPCSC